MNEYNYFGKISKNVKTSEFRNKSYIFFLSEFFYAENIPQLIKNIEK